MPATLAELIDQAAHREGSHGALAKRLGVDKTRLSQWKHGHRPCPLEMQGLIAEAAGEDPGAWQWAATLKQIGRAATAAVVALALALAAWSAPGADGAGRLARA